MGELMHQREPEVVEAVQSERERDDRQLAGTKRRAVSVGPLQARHDDAPHAKREQSTRHLAHLLRPLRQLQDARDAGLELRPIVGARRLLRSEDLDATSPVSYTHLTLP